ncbi:glycogen-binding domain-containing protein [Natranaerobius thermophilus]|uniref:AMP-activated protein kinase glycogen-binding domain-containing protein n=1 Tax=Natranaerobius thermophilus (strain ATCC BAA-1301 / DSM 18059 / JW/NM-WN-LF) TaxID=457570 RepID=B2A176_NATTJ|nr:glycogen-binding domain-containing protein [Natranaerobius thermophilus]ACB86017.1 conserved hypothetical protein [Natranaerobius thermophilus JW/NM-WN-LF]
MEVTLSLDKDPNIPIEYVEIIGNFTKYQNSLLMEEDKDCWLKTIKLPPGEHLYAFLINGNLRLNDPKANIYMLDNDDQIWSVIIINERGERLYNNQKYSVHIEEYKLSSVMSEKPIKNHKRQYDRFLDQKIVARFLFTQVTGLHSITTAWYTPQGNLFQVSENYLIETNSKETQTKMLWFWLDLRNSKHQLPCGLWTLKLFVDGAFILEDKFQLLEKGYYSIRGDV